MEKFRLYLDNNLKEKNPTDKYHFPFRIGYEHLSNYDKNSFPCHWHSEVEFTYVTEGSMEYQANDAVYTVDAGNAIFVNSNVLHSARTQNPDMDCSYIAFIVNPIIIFGYEDSLIYNQYVNPICSEPALFSKLLDKDTAFGQQMIASLLEISRIQHSFEAGYELLITEKLCALWFLLYQNLKPHLNQKETGTTTDINRLKTAISFIQSHYDENITLQDIAASCHVSKSECCHLFKRTLRQTPFTYLLDYRIQRSIPLILEGNNTITEIAAQTGFHGSSYFTETFKKIMNCTPRDYKKMHMK